MWKNCALGPFRANMDPMMKRQPSVNVMANFRAIIVGRNSANARNTKNTPTDIMSPKYVRAVLEGKLLVAFWTFPGNSRTLFVTLHKFHPQIHTSSRHEPPSKSGSQMSLISKCELQLTRGHLLVHKQ